jgi:hypothetical protein
MDCVLLEHDGIKLEMNSKWSHRKYSEMWRLHNKLLNGQWATKEIRCWGVDAGVVAQEVEWLPDKLEALNSNPSTSK